MVFCDFIMKSSLGISLLFNLRLLCTLVLFSKTLVSDGNTMRHKPTHGDGVAQDKPGISWREFRSLLTVKERI